MLPVNYKCIADAVEFYGTRGYGYLDVPWSVDGKALEITAPPGSSWFPHADKWLVASGEQSFLEMLQRKTLKPGKHLCVTPCFRRESEYHEYTRPYFMKAELIIAGSEDPMDMECALHDAADFFNRYLPKPVKFQGTEIGTDIMYDGIELGSYGIRNHETTGPWVYGTGVAEPRFSYVLSRIPKGYSAASIPRGIYGELSKIVEEAEELKDACAQGVEVMTLVELSDLYGAIEGFLRKKFPFLNMEDLRKMSAVTKRAFENGYRT